MDHPVDKPPLCPEQACAAGWLPATPVEYVRMRSVHARIHTVNCIMLATHLVTIVVGPVANPLLPIIALESSSTTLMSSPLLGERGSRLMVTTRVPAKTACEGGAMI